MYCFRFPDKDTFRTLAAAEGLVTEDGELITASHTHSIDEIGIITTGGSYDPETGEVIEPPTVLDGWHVNYVGEPIEAWTEFIVTPNSPVRVFAGCSYSISTDDNECQEPTKTNSTNCIASLLLN